MVCQEVEPRKRSCPKSCVILQAQNTNLPMNVRAAQVTREPCLFLGSRGGVSDSDSEAHANKSEETALHVMEVVSAGTWSCVNLAFCASPMGHLLATPSILLWFE